MGGCCIFLCSLLGDLVQLYDNFCRELKKMGKHQMVHCMLIVQNLKMLRNC